MRILTINVIGIPSGSSSNLLEANVLQDFDAVVVDPDDLGDIFGRMDYFNRDKSILTPEFGSTLFVWSVKRRLEVTGLLQRGGIVVCFMEPKMICYYHSENKQREITNYDWLLSTKEMFNELGGITVGRGDTIDKIDSAHPFSEYCNIKPSWSAYVSTKNCTDWKILASAYGTHAVALTKRVGLGHIVLLPSYYDYHNGELLERCIARLLGDKEITPQPDWVRDILVPGQQELNAKIVQVNEQLGSLEQERTVLEGEYHKLERWKYLLYEKGKHQLEPVVREAFELLGCDVQPQPDKDSDGSVTCEHGTALLEVSGSKSTIKIVKLGELTKNMGNYVAQKEAMVKGVLVGNPFCEEPLDNRPPHGTQRPLFAKELLEGAEQQSIAVILSSDVYDIVCRILNNEFSSGDKQDIRRRIFEGKGLVRLI